MADPRGIRTQAEWTRALQALFASPGLSYHLLAERPMPCVGEHLLQALAVGGRAGLLVDEDPVIRDALCRFPKSSVPVSEVLCANSGKRGRC